MRLQPVDDRDNQQLTARQQALRLSGWLLALLPLGWLAGTALQLQQRDLSGIGLYAAALLLAAALALTLRARWQHLSPMPAFVMACLLTSALTAWGSAGWRASQRQQLALAPAQEGVDLLLTGTIASLPQQGEGGWRFLLDVEHAEQDGQPVIVPPRVQLIWYTSAAPWRAASGASASETSLQPAYALQAGDRWRLTVRLKAPHGNINPHGFDYELWLWSRRIGATGYVRNNRKAVAPQRLEQAVAHPVQRWRQAVRDRILALAPTDAGEGVRQRLGVVAALATGDQNAIARADWDVFRVTGVAHLVSISGLHIGMMAWLAALIVGFVWRRSVAWRRLLRVNLCAWLPAPKAALAGALLFGTAYAVFSGWGVPAQRTVIMLAVVIVLRLAGVRWPWWLTWLWAAALVLAFDPWAMLQAGFWLSFVAVGILFATGSRAADATSDRFAKVRTLFVVQGKMTLALAPLTLMLFGQASVIGLLANLVAIPWVTLIVTPAALAGLLWPLAWQVASVSLLPLLALLEFMADQPWAQLTTAAAPLSLGLAAAAGTLLMVLRLPLALRSLGLPLLLPLLFWQPMRPPPGEFAVVALDVGQGSALLLQTAGHSLLYDTGPRFSAHSDAGERVILPLLQALAEAPDLLMLSHRDSDHTGGAATVHAAYPQARVVASLAPGDGLPGVPQIHACRAGERWTWDGVQFEVLFPEEDDVVTARSSNAISCVLRVSSGRAAVLFTGDLEAPQERQLVARDRPLQADVLIVPHHGSNTSSTPELLQTVAPRLALIQSGYRNRYGHPTERILARYATYGIRTHVSPVCGAMHWRSQTPDRLVCEREHARRYWRHDAVRRP